MCGADDGATRAQELIRRLELRPHPEGGWYRELYRSPLKVSTARGERAAVTMIYYLLEAHQLSRWHVVGADEIWHHYGGAPLELYAYEPGTRELRRHLLEPAGSGDGPVAVIRAGIWQAARSRGSFSLLGCSVAPGFEFADFRFVASLVEHAAHFETSLSKLRELL
jgi:uncharacterized protein